MIAHVTGSFRSLSLVFLSCLPGLCSCTNKSDPVDTAEVDSRDSDSDEDDTEADDSGDSDSGDSEDTGPRYAPVSDVSVELHPRVQTVLVVTWNQDEAVDGAWLEFSFEKDEWMTSPERARGVGEAREVILGVPAEAKVTFKVGNRRGDRYLLSELSYLGTTGVLPADLPLPELFLHDPARLSDEPYMLGTVDTSRNWYQGPFYMFILDREGRYVWYYPIPDSRCAMFAQVSADGTHLLVDGTTYYVYDGSISPTITRLTLDLAMEETLVLEDLGFSFDEVEGGAILYHSRDRTDALFELSPSGEKREIWNCPQYMRDNGFRGDLCMPNSVIHTSSTDAVLWSMFQNDTVVEIDRASGEVLRRFGQLSGGYDFDPPEAVVDYQHYPNYTPDGTLIVSTHVLGERGQQRTREFYVDDLNQLLTERWSFGDGVDHYADYGGEAQRLGNGNSLLCYGTEGTMLEVSDEGEIVWDLEWPSEPNTHLLGHNTLLTDLYALNAGPAVVK